MRTTVLLVACVAACAVAVAAKDNQASFHEGNNNVGDHNRFIVKFKETDEHGRRLNSVSRASVLSAAGATTVMDQPKLRQSVVSANRNARRALRRNANVEFIERDRPVFPTGLRASRNLVEQLGWALNDVQGYHHLDNPVTVCIIDSGLNTDHEDINESICTGSNGNLQWDVDGCGHGTHVSGTIGATNGNDLGMSGVANLKMHTVRVFADNCDWAYSSSLQDAISECAATPGVKVISMSLGRTGNPSNSEESAIDDAVASGIAVVAAAGNSGSTSVGYPASYDSVVSVAAHANGGSIASFSTHNEFVDISAPGVSVRSTYRGGNSAYASLSGTSMATPHVAACAGVLMSIVPSASVQDVRDAMESTAVDGGAPGFDIYFGHGMLRCRDALEALQGCRAEPDLSVTLPTGSSRSCDEPLTADVAFDDLDDCSGSTRDFALVATSSNANLGTTQFVGGAQGKAGTVVVRIKSDNYPSEISFRLSDTATGSTLATQAFGTGTQVEREWSFPVETTGDVRVTFLDSYGDGYCCSYGRGWYAAGLAGETLNIVEASFDDMAELDVALPDNDGSSTFLDVTSDPFNAQLQLEFNPDGEGPLEVTVNAMAGNAVAATRTLSFECTAGPPPDPPAAPSAVSVTPSATSATVTWGDESDDETGFRVTRTATGLQAAATVEVGADVTSYTDDDLPPSSTVSYSVEAFNAGGSSAAVSSGSFVSAPVAPTGLTASGTTQTSTTLSWAAHPDATASIRVERDGAAVASLAAGATQYTDATLSPETTYSFALVAEGAAFDSPPSDAVPVTTLPNAPDGPADVVATATSPTTVAVTWTAPAGTVQSYTVERTSGQGTQSFPDATSGFVDDTASPGTTYSYCVSATNAGGTSACVAAADVTTPEACVESDPTVSAPSPTTVDCSGASATVRIPVSITNQDTAVCDDSAFSAAAASSDEGLSLAFENGSTAGASVTVEIFTDNWPQETSFTLGPVGGAVEFTASPERQNLNLNTWTVDVTPGVDYVFTILDAYGDGICCSYGEGYYRVVNAAGDELAAGGRFRSSRSHTLAAADLADGSGAATSPTLPAGPNAAAVANLDVTVDGSHAPGTAFTISLLAFRGDPRNDNGDATATLEVQCQLPQPPVPPTNLALTAGTPSWSVVEMTWTDAAATETSYTVRYIAPGEPDFTVLTLPADSEGATLTGLAARTQYDVEVFASNAGGDSSTVSAIFSTTIAPPPAPTAFTATLGGDEQSVELAWTLAATDASNAASTSQVFRRVAGSGDFGAPHLELPVPGAAATDTAVDTDTTYEYAVAAANAAGVSELVGPVTVVVPPQCEPAAPTIEVTATAENGVTSFPCNKEALFAVSFTITNNDSPVCGTQAFTVSTHTLPSGFSRCDVLTASPTADSFPSEFSYRVVRDSDSEVVMAGDAKAAERRVCSAATAYTAVLSDSGGDGICCGYPLEGSFTLALDDGQPLVEVAGAAAAFGASASFPFTLPRDFSFTLEPQGTASGSFTVAAANGVPGANPISLTVAGTSGSASASDDSNLACTPAP